MITSMTGYGRSEAVMGGRSYVVEIKSVNHRYLEISLRRPSGLLSLELEIKKRIAEQLSRGRIEVIIRVDSNNSQKGEVRYELNLPMIRIYYEMLVSLKQELDLKDEITLAMIAGCRDAFMQPEPSPDVAFIWVELGNVLDGAMAALKEMRSKEGENLYRDLTLRTDSIKKALDYVALRSPQIALEYQVRVTDRIKVMTGGGIIDDFRLTQEIAIMAEKSDITEEIVRLRSHIDQFGDLLKSNDAVGRKIDFLIQEMVKEVNTISTKSGDLEISRNIVEIKTELAKLREQVQNIE